MFHHGAGGQENIVKIGLRGVVEVVGAVEDGPEVLGVGGNFQAGGKMGPAGLLRGVDPVERVDGLARGGVAVDADPDFSRLVRPDLPDPRRKAQNLP